MAGGPVISYTTDRAFGFGWEAGGGYTPFVRGNIGGIYRESGENGSSENIHYLVAEPWLVVGGTFGVALIDIDRFDTVLGIWEAIPYNPERESGSGILGKCSEREHPNFMTSDSDFVSLDDIIVSFAFGYRHMGRAGEFYFTPKLGMIDCQPEHYLTIQ